jgi:hypothetical protein
MRGFMKLIAALMTLLFALVSMAQELSYPELNVTPRASKRIKLEVSDEASHNFKSFLPIQVSALTTIAAGFSLSGKVEDHLATNPGDTVDDGDKAAPSIAMGVGALWIAATTWAAASYRPYNNGYVKLKSQMKKMGKMSKRDMLTIERLAEEEINSLAKMGMRLRWLSFATNAGIASMLNSSNAQKTEDQEGAAFVANLSMVTALAPLFFKTRWEHVADEQEKYKKKIYAPVSMTPILTDPTKTVAATGFNLLWTY